MILKSQIERWPYDILIAPWDSSKVMIVVRDHAGFQKIKQEMSEFLVKRNQEPLDGSRSMFLFDKELLLEFKLRFLGTKNANRR